MDWTAVCIWWWADETADTDVGGVEPLENVVRGVADEKVGLSIVWPPASEIVMLREMLPLRPHEEIEPGSDGVILDRENWDL
jgi:hypothetical protein